MKKRTLLPVLPLLMGLLLLGLAACEESPTAPGPRWKFCGGTFGVCGDGRINWEVEVTTRSLPDAALTVAYGQTLSATIGIFATFSWSVTVGSLPTGLNLSSGGAITGTPTKVGISNFTVRATTGSLSDQQALSITVNAT